jgi:hypothetical protein
MDDNILQQIKKWKTDVNNCPQPKATSLKGTNTTFVHKPIFRHARPGFRCYRFSVAQNSRLETYAGVFDIFTKNI